MVLHPQKLDYQYHAITGRVHYRICHGDLLGEKARTLDSICKQTNPSLLSMYNNWITESQAIASAEFIKICNAFSLKPESDLLAEGESIPKAEI